ncbi:hypothetical protein (mitochondrion) [Phanerochaete sordida]|uniref:Homing endonuclease LAGLIDADG domain-containing protein n=1 Tax=Phanerochaete sordida TaxID=48140 RepID=A0A9N7Q8A5_9APHY|nr:hypothetical protein [Phanerochaete sordida]
MHQTVSENFMNNLLDTLVVSCILPDDSTSLNFLFSIPYFKTNGSFSSVLINSFPTNTGRNYSTLNKESYSNSLELGSKSQQVYTLDPFFITGFIDAVRPKGRGGSFMLSLIKDSKYKTGWAVKLTFAIVLHQKDSVLLESIRSTLGGIGTISNHVNGIQFRVRSKSDLEVLIKFLDKFTLISQKRIDYLLFKEAFEILSNKLHLTTEGLQKLFEIKTILNTGTSQFLAYKDVANKELNNLIDSVKPTVLQEIKSSHWLAGFTSGEGGFYIQIQGNKVSFKFYINQHERDKALLESFISYLGCCSSEVRVETFNSLSVFVVTKLIDIDEKIIPLFKNYPIHGIKFYDFQDFCEVVRLIKAKEHLTKKGLDKVKEIKNGMNRQRTLKEAAPINTTYDIVGSEGSSLSEEYMDTNFIQNSIIPHEKVGNDFCTSKVKILLNMNNPQVTKAFNTLVGTSEAIRLLNKDINLNSQKKDNNKFNQWLAGLIDGDGCFQLTKKGYASLEITMNIREEHALQIVKNVYGGSIKLRSGANALRYRLHHKSGLLKLINDVNGEIRNSNRLVQLNKICHKYELNLIYPEKLTFDNAWLSGFFDADGTVTINQTNTQLSISASQKTSELLQPLTELYGGNIYIDRGSSQSFKWYITKREDILKLIDYFKKYTPKSAKKNRLYLIPKFYELKDLKAHKALTGSFLEKSWLYFYNKWLKFEDLN